MGFFDFFKLKEQPKDLQRTIVVQKADTGTSGTEIYAGIFDEEYLQDLSGTLKAEIYDKMRRNDGVVKMCLSAVKNPIISAEWKWKAGGGEDVHKLHAEFLDHVFKNDLGGKRKKKFKRLMNEALSCVIYGYTVFERTHKTVMKNPKFGDYVGLKNLGWRSPKTLEYFHVDADGELESIEQQAYGDIESLVKMDAKYLNIITIDQEGDNYEGISLLRPCYGPWLRKQVNLKLMAIGNEKHALGTPSMEVPAGKENSTEFEKAEAMLQKLNSHEMNYIMYPQGWKFEYHFPNFDPEKLKKSIEFEDQQMIFSFLANFLNLGANGSGGAYALSNDLSDFFENGIIYIADMIVEEFGDIGRDLIDLNFGPQEVYPELTYSGITDKIGKEFSEIIKALTDSGNFTPDDDVENELRRRLKLSPMKEEDKRENQEDEDPIDNDPSPDDNNDNDGEPGDDAEPDQVSDDSNDDSVDDLDSDAELKDPIDTIKLAEKNAKQQIKNSREKIIGIMRKNLSSISGNLSKDIIKNYKGLSDSKKIEAINGVESKGKAQYLKDIKAVLTEVAFDAMKQVSKEMPSNVRNLWDPEDSIRLGEFEKLPPSVKKYLLLQSRLIVQTTTADLEKIVFMQFGDSVLSTDSASLIEDDLKQSGETFINGSSVVAAGGNTASRIINESRTAAFFDDQVLDEIESFTFVNPDPTAPICKDLAGRTFRADDPEARRNFPPLHHNCESYIVANFVGGKNNPEIDPRGLKTKFVSTF